MSRRLRILQMICRQNYWKKKQRGLIPHLEHCSLSPAWMLLSAAHPVSFWYFGSIVSRRYICKMHSIRWSNFGNYFSHVHIQIIDSIVSDGNNGWRLGLTTGGLLPAAAYSILFLLAKGTVRSCHFRKMKRNIDNSNRFLFCKVTC